jgi:hypothetical protein
MLLIQELSGESLIFKEVGEAGMTEARSNNGGLGEAAAHDEGIVKPPHVLAAEQAIEALATSPLTMPQRLKFDLVRIASMSFAPNREAKVAARVKEYEGTASECIRHYSIDGFDRERSAFWRDIGELSRPVNEPTFADNLAGHVAGMNQRGWLSRECEVLKRYAEGGAGGTDRIVSYTVNDATLASGKTITRAQIRDELRPSWQADEHWRESGDYQAMKRAYEAALAKENQRQEEQRRSTVISAGPGHLIGKQATDVTAAK